MKTETMKRDVCYLCDKNTKMKTTDFVSDKIFTFLARLPSTSKFKVPYFVQKTMIDSEYDTRNR